MSTQPINFVRKHLPLALATLTLLATACGSSEASDDTVAPTSAAAASTTDAPDATEPAGTVAPTTELPADTQPPASLEGSIRIGYFGNVTHAPAVIGEEEGLFAQALGDGVDIEFV